MRFACSFHAGSPVSQPILACLVLALALVLGPATLPAQDLPNIQPLLADPARKVTLPPIKKPITAEKIVQRAVLAIGGIEACESRQSTHSINTASRANGQTYRWIHYQANGRSCGINDYGSSRQLWRTETMPGRSPGEAPGILAWTKSAAGTISLVDGEFGDAYAIERGMVTGFAHCQQLYQKMEYQGQVLVGDRSAYRVVMTTHQGTEVIFYFDCETNLFIRRTRPPRGNLPEEIVDVGDYRWSGKYRDVLYPHQSTVQRGIDIWRYKVESLEFNVDLPPELFEIPAEIQPRYLGLKFRQWYGPMEMTWQKLTGFQFASRD